MDGIVASLGPVANRNLIKEIQASKDASLRTRCLVVYNLDNRYSPTQVAEILMISRTNVHRVAERYTEHGLDGLRDLRENNGQRKVTTAYLKDLNTAVEESAQDYQWPSPTWTRKLLIATMKQLEHPSIHPTTLSQALHAIGAETRRL